MYTRYIYSIIVGTTITVGLLFVMQLLIASGKSALTEPRARHLLEFVRVRRNENINTEDLTPEKPPKPPEVPQEMPPQDMDSIDPNVPTIAIPPPTVNNAIIGAKFPFPNSLVTPPSPNTIRIIISGNDFNWNTIDPIGCCAQRGTSFGSGVNIVSFTNLMVAYLN